jgi:hypothetical protein
LNKDHPNEVEAENWSKWTHPLLRCSLGIAGDLSWKNESQQTTFDHMHQALEDQILKQNGAIKTKKAIMNSQSDVQVVKATSLVC